MGYVEWVYCHGKSAGCEREVFSFVEEGIKPYNQYIYISCFVDVLTLDMYNTIIKLHIPDTP